MVGKSQARMFRGEKPGETKLAPEWTLERVAKHAIDFWLSTEDLPRPDNRVTRRRRRQADARATRRRTTCRSRSCYEKLQVDARQARHERGPPDPPLRLHEERDPGRGLSRTRPARAASAPIRRRRCSTSTAARTSSTTSTSSTRASSRASARSTRRSRRWRTRSASATTCSSGWRDRVGARDRLPPSGEQIELAFGDQRAVVVEVGGGLRTYSADGRELLDGYAADEMCTLRPRAGADAVAEPARGRELRVRRPQPPAAAHEPEHGNAIHGLVRWAPWTVAEREPHRVVLEHVLRPQPGYPFSLALRVEYALVGRRAERCARPRRTSAPCPAPTARGAHPYLTLGTPTVDPLVLRVPGATVLAPTSAGCPIGAGPSTAPIRLPPAAADRRDAARPRFTDLERDDDGLARVELEDPDGGAGSRSGWTRATRT